MLLLNHVEQLPEFHYIVYYYNILYIIMTSLAYLYSRLGRDMVTAIFTYIVIGNLIQIRCPKPLFQVYEQNTNNSDV